MATPELPEAVVFRIAFFLLPPEPPLPPLCTPSGVDTRADVPGPSGASGDVNAERIRDCSAAHNARCAAAWAPLAAMRAVCKDWCAAVTQALRCPPGWLPPDKALAPPGRWRGAPLTTLCIAVPFDQLAQEPDLDAWQADVRQQLQRLYPSLHTVRWQALDLLGALESSLCWAIRCQDAHWWVTPGPAGGGESRLGPLPRLVADSQLCPERTVQVLGGGLWWGPVVLAGPLTVRGLIRGVEAAAVRAVAPRERAMGGVVRLSLGPEEGDEEVDWAARAGAEAGRLRAPRELYETVEGHAWFQSLRPRGGGVYEL